MLPPFSLRRSTPCGPPSRPTYNKPPPTHHPPPPPPPQILDRCRAQWRHVLCDESQDTNQAQFALLRLLLGERNTLFAVGDPNQVRLGETVGGLCGVQERD